MYREDLGYHNISMYVIDFITLEVIDFIVLVYNLYLNIVCVLFFFFILGKLYVNWLTCHYQQIYRTWHRLATSYDTKGKDLYLIYYTIMHLWHDIHLD